MRWDAPRREAARDAESARVDVTDAMDDVSGVCLRAARACERDGRMHGDGYKAREVRIGSRVAIGGREAAAEDLIRVMSPSAFVQVCLYVN